VDSGVREKLIRAREENNVNRYTVWPYRCAVIALETEWLTADGNQSLEGSGDTVNDHNVWLKKRNGELA
jgi:hypothetical protein